MRRAIVLAGLVLGCAAVAQESTSFKLTEHVFNSGGHPEGGVVLTSASFEVSLDALGDRATSVGLGAASFIMDGGFVAGYPPPGEVLDLLFTGKKTLVWDPERSAGTYNLYRDLRSNLTGSGFGNCEQQQLPSNTATDDDPLPAGDGYFYLITVGNRLDEEGTKGFQSDGTEREGAICP